ncbi:unnamed protein product [Sphenostylis stenocarpa]|uniref:BHLH domain-containing protein n=1 Tax=Sphenostylis stenocarpa TaxID=92480 RepID=A0AA86SD55_9FABA|nr:unnamed protein product [Sphenostylis stenocarpa]
MGVIGRWGQNLIGSRCWLRWWGPAAGYCPNQSVAGITERSMVSLNDPTGICPTIPSIRTLHFMGHAAPIQCMIGSLSAHQRENVESPIATETAIAGPVKLPKHGESHPSHVMFVISRGFVLAVGLELPPHAPAEQLEILLLEGFVHMGSESATPAVETSKNRSSSGKTNQGKVPRKIHKAEREKMKREHLNELFLDLANALDVNENNGKASILCEAARLLKDLLSQIQSLKKENVTLLSESHYVTMEKNELKEENCSLETQIEKLQGEINARVAQSKPDLNVHPHLELAPLEQPNFPGQSLQLHTMEPNLQQGSAVLLVPFPPDLQASFPASNVTEVAPNSTSVISKPHARYPTAADSWPSQLLG